MVTEKIDGTNGLIKIWEPTEPVPTEAILVGNLAILSGSRNRWCTPESDNYGLAAWVRDNRLDIVKLGVGSHYGEWWGHGIQRGYGLKEKAFSLFDPDPTLELPAIVRAVPVLYYGEFSTEVVKGCLSMLQKHGSVAAPGFMRPEGVVVTHMPSRHKFKATLDGDSKDAAKFSDIGWTRQDKI